MLPFRASYQNDNKVQRICESTDILKRDILHEMSKHISSGGKMSSAEFAHRVVNVKRLNSGQRSDFHKFSLVFTM